MNGIERIASLYKEHKCEYCGADNDLLLFSQLMLCSKCLYEKLIPKLREKHVYEPHEIRLVVDRTPERMGR